MSWQDLSDFEKGYLACQTENTRLSEMIAAKRPIEKNILKLAAEQGLCPACKQIILRFANHD